MDYPVPSPRLDRRSIGRRIRFLVEHQDGNIARFARRTGFPETTIYRIVSGDVIPTPHTLVILSRLLGCSVDFLLGVCCPESDPGEGFEETLLNIREFRTRWSRAQRLFLLYALIGFLSGNEEEQLRFIREAEQQKLPGRAEKPADLPPAVPPHDAGPIKPTGNQPVGTP